MFIVFLYSRVAFAMVIAVGSVSFELRKPGDKQAAPWRRALSPEKVRVKAQLKAKAAPARERADAPRAAGDAAPVDAPLASGRRRRRRQRKSSAIVLQHAPTELLHESFDVYMAEVAKTRMKAEPVSPYVAGRHRSPGALSP